MSYTTQCSQCGGELENSRWLYAYGIRADKGAYCSAACRQKAYRARKKESGGRIVKVLASQVSDNAKVTVTASQVKSNARITVTADQVRRNAMIVVTASQVKPGVVLPTT